MAGSGVQPFVILRVKTASGRQLYQRKGTGFGRVIEPQYVAMMNTMMQETLLTGTARKAELPGWQAAGKTGTSQDWRDAWFVGYTSHLVTTVWLGNDDGTPTKKASGGNLPVEIWSRFMKAAHANVPAAALPGGTWREAPAAGAGLISGLFGPREAAPAQTADSRPMPACQLRASTRAKPRAPAAPRRHPRRRAPGARRRSQFPGTPIRRVGLAREQPRRRRRA